MHVEMQFLASLTEKKKSHAIVSQSNKLFECCEIIFVPFWHIHTILKRKKNEKRKNTRMQYRRLYIYVCTFD